MALPGNLIVSPTADAACTALAIELRRLAWRVVQARGCFHIALSGGTTPEPVYRQLAQASGGPPDFPWAATRLWLVDERCVPESDSRSNLRMIRAALAHAPAQIEGLDATKPEAAELYEQRLRDALTDGHLDCVLLGLGSDGHTASLFPNSPALNAPPGRWVVSNDGPSVTPPARITLTAPFINNARAVYLLATGSSKAAPLGALARQPGGDARALPVRLIRPRHGTLTFFIDRAASAELGT